MTTLYHYDRDSGEFLRQSKARLDPIEKKPLVPADSTLKSPPSTQKNTCAVFIKEEWKIISDHRGQDYYLSDGSKHRVEELGEELPANALHEPPPPTLDNSKNNATQRIETTSEHARVQATNNASLHLLSTRTDKAQRAQRVTGKTASKADMDVLQAEAEQRGRNESPEELAQKQLGKAQAQAKSVALIDGIESAALDAIGNAQTSDEVEAIVENHRQALETALAADPAVEAVAKRKIPGSDALKKLVGIASPN